MNVELVMVGDGKFKEILHNKADELGIGERVKFLGKVSPGKSVYEVLDNSDLYVLPSRQEGLPRSLIEAMARGLPCIASNVGGIPELLDDDFMVALGDAQALADKIMWTLGDVRRLVLAARANREKAVYTPITKHWLRRSIVDVHSIPLLSWRDGISSVR